MVLQRFPGCSLPVYRCGNLCFFARKDNLREQVSLTESWAMQGVYLFLAENLDPPEDFPNQMMDFLRRCAPWPLFLWIRNVQEHWGHWQLQALLPEKEGEKRLAARPSPIRLAGYSLDLAGGLPVRLEQDRFLFDSGELGASPFLFRTPGLACTAASSLILSAKGHFLFSIRAAAQEGQDVFSLLGVGIRYFALPADSTPVWFRAGAGRIHCKTLLSGEPLTLSADWAPLEPGLCQFHLPENAVFSTAMATVSGQPVSLKTGADAALVFETQPQSLSHETTAGKRNARQTLYLGLQGSFALLMKESRLLCGMTGTEFADLSENRTIDVRFTAHHPAFLEPDGSPSSLGTAPRLVFCGGLRYYSQPETAPLFQGAKQGALRLLEAPAEIYKTESPAVPMAFYRGCRLNLLHPAELRTLEARIHAERRSLLKQECTGKGSGEQVGVTPQGLMVGVDCASGTWNWVGLARTTAGSGAPDLILRGISASLRRLFQQKRLFLALTSGAELLQMAQPEGEFSVTADGWKFLLAPDQWKKDETALILKLTDEASLMDLAGDIPALQNAVKLSYGNDGKPLESCLDFFSALNDPSFQGILFLGCRVWTANASSLPPTLLKGVDPEGFRAHHLILRENRVEWGEAKGLLMRRSSVSALLDYTNGAHAAQTVQQGEPLPYDFSTTEISVTITDSKVTAFRSVSELLVNILFGSACKRDAQGGNCLLLDGTLQKNGSCQEYCFTLRDPVGYLLPGSAIQSLRITEASLLPDGKGSYIRLGGILDFVVDPACDLFSYGSEKDEASDSGLRFSGLCVRIPEEGPLSADYSGLLLSPSDGGARKQSFASRFPADLERLYVSSAQEDPEALGWRAVTAPLRQGKLGPSWTGLIWRLNLGSLGALSSGGAFSIRLLTAWSPGAPDASYYVGIHMPSIQGGVLDLQGILKLGFQSIELTAEKDDTEKRNYALCLHNFSVSVLGARFPPGSSDLLIFADGKKLGWYAKYQEKE